MEKSTADDKNSSSSPSSTSEVRDSNKRNVSPPRYSFASPSAQEIRENRNTIIKILDTLTTLKNLQEIRARNELQQQAGVATAGSSAETSCGNCPCTKRSVLEADIKYLQQLLAHSGFKISRANSILAYQEQDIIKSAKFLYKAVEKSETEGVDKKRQKLESTDQESVVEDESATKKEAILKAVRWLQNKKRSQYAFDTTRSEFSVVETQVEWSEIGDFVKEILEN